MLSRRLGRAALVASKRSIRPLSTAKLVELDEEFPGLPSLTPAAPVAVKVESSTLPNGVKVVSTEAGRSTSVGVAVGAGSKYETVSEYGAAHVLQHLAFKATTSKSALRALRDLEAVGSAPSAYAGRDSIVYKVTSLPEHAEEALAATFETILSPKITPYGIRELQASAIAYDLELLASSGKQQLIEALYEAAYGENTPLGHAFYATSPLTPEILAGFRAKTFTSSGFTVVGTGVAHSQLVSWVAGLTNHVAKAPAASAPSSPYVAGESRVKASSDTTYVGLAFPAPAKGDAGSLAVLAAAWDAALPAGATSFVLPGIVGVAGGVPAAEAGKFTEKLVQVVKTAVPSAAAKTAAKISALKKLDSSLFDAVADGVDAAVIDSVQDADVNALAGKLWKAGVSIASVGNLRAVPKLSTITK